MTLDQQIKEKGQEISTDAYPMSIGELVNLFRDGELNVHPEFQRFFRWTSYQKSRFVESLLLGIPIPSIFVAEQEDGTWELVDGLQRFSTVLELMGELPNSDGEVMPPLMLEATKYLPAMGGLRWISDSDNGNDELPSSAKLKIKRSRLDLKIILGTSDSSAKYELFQRLNTGGSIATDQEVRNCILIMINKDFFRWMHNLADSQSFQNCLPISERQRDEQFDMELLVRFLVLTRLGTDQIREIRELGTFLTEEAIELAKAPDFETHSMETIFSRVFDRLDHALGEDAFKKFDPDRGRALGPPLVSVYEVMALGMGYALLNGAASDFDDDTVTSIHESLWTRADFTSAAASGVRASARIPRTINIGRELFTSS